MVSVGRLQARLCTSIRKMSPTKTNENIREHKTDTNQPLTHFHPAHLTVIPGMGFGSEFLPRRFRHQ